MHHRFEIRLIVDAIVDAVPNEPRDSFSRKVMHQHVKRYLDHYHAEHGELPTDRRYLGMTRPLHLEIGMVDFAEVRRKIRSRA